MASIDVDTNAVIEELLDRIKRLTLENVVLTKALEQAPLSHQVNEGTDG